MFGWHHRLNGHESEQALGVGDGQGRLACCSPWGRKESDTTEGMNRTELNWPRMSYVVSSLLQVSVCAQEEEMETVDIVASFL